MRFGDTAAAKTLYAVRPQAMLPWEAPIRRAFWWTRGGGSTCQEFLGLAADATAARSEESVDFDTPEGREARA